MSKPSEELIYDRTQLDVDNATLKGQYNASDLNRVEKWCRYLADELNTLGYNISITTKTNWVQTDQRREAELERIRTNIKKIQQGYYYVTQIEANVDKWNWQKANNWELILNELYGLMFGMRNMYIYGGVSRGGEPLLWQNNFMHLFNG